MKKESLPLGHMDMPGNFPYKKVFLQGKNHHEGTDSFLLRHPRMTTGHRAKIFAPFDALRGFDLAIDAKTVAYEEKREVNEQRERALSETLASLQESVLQRRHPIVSVTFYMPCSDENNFAYGIKGTYETVTDIVWKVDADVMKTIRVGDCTIPLEDLWEILKISEES